MPVPFQCVCCKYSGEMRRSSGLRRPAIWMVGIQDGRTCKLSVHTQNNAPSFSLILLLSIHYSGFSLFSSTFSLLSGLSCAIYTVLERNPKFRHSHLNSLLLRSLQMCWKSKWHGKMYNKVQKRLDLYKHLNSGLSVIDMCIILIPAAL